MNNVLPFSTRQGCCPYIRRPGFGGRNFAFSKPAERFQGQRQLRLFVHPVWTFLDLLAILFVLAKDFACRGGLLAQPPEFGVPCGVFLACFQLA